MCEGTSHRSFQISDMTICVFSDSHGSTEGMLRAIGREKPVLCFFLGDGERDLAAIHREYPDLPVFAVRGNCDVRSKLPLTIRCAVGGVSVFATHGHTLQVKHDALLHELRDAASGARVVLYGHTHIPHCQDAEGQLLINPGSVGPFGPASYALLHIENGVPTAEIKSV